MRDSVQSVPMDPGIESAPTAVGIPPADQDVFVFPMSYAQQRLWFLAQMEPDSAFYNTHRALRLRGRLRRDALARSLALAVRRHESLRTTFMMLDGEPVQVVVPGLDLPLPTIDLERLPEEARWAEARCLAAQAARRTIDLARGPLLRIALLRLGDADHVLLLNTHHIVSDAGSMGILVREVAGAYRAFAEGRRPVLPALPIQYADFAEWQRGYLQGEVLATQLAYWRERLEGMPPLELPADHPRPAEQTFRGAVQPLALSPSREASLRRMARDQGATLFMALLAGFQALLARTTGQLDVSVGFPVSGRTQIETEGLIGLFLNTLVARTDLSGDPLFPALLGRVRQVVLEAHAHQDLPFERLVDELRVERDLSASPLFRVLFTLESTPKEELRLPDLSLEPLEVESGTAKLDLTLSLVEDGGRVLGGIEYNTDLFDAPTIVRFGEHFQNLLAGAVDGARLSELPLLGDAESQALLREHNDTGVAWQPGLLHEPFASWARRSPGATALVWGEERLTYGELAALAGHLSGRLLSLGIGPEERVGICAERSAEMVWALLGVLQAGAAYVPLDPAYPPERVAFMLEDSGASVVLTQRRLLDRLPEAAGRTVLVLEELAGAAEAGCAPPRRPDPANLAYVIYTSGSTGRPKGVAIEHRSASLLVRWAGEVFQPEELAGVLASTSICFDLSVFELFVPLGHGGTVILAQDALELPSLPAAGEVRLVNTVPSAAAELVRSGGLPSSVITVNLAGEPLRRRLASDLYEMGVGRVFDLYGPSEDTTYSTFALVPAEGERPVLIGRPVGGSAAYVLDGSLRPVPLGATGELCLGGKGLARGYLGRPELTAERFAPDPCGGEPGARLYRTGDLARRLPDGSLDFLGRIDHQVKLRGFRIELGEVELALGSHPGVREAVVLAVESAAGGRSLAAWFVPESVAGNGRIPSSAELREHLRRKLPEFMVPSSYVALEAFPLTPNGKIDRRALPAPEPPRRTGRDNAPRTAEERLLAAIWAEVLQLGQVGIHDSFFALGGDSILSLQMVSRAARAGLRITPRQVFQHQTIAELAAVAEGTAALSAVAEQGLVTGSVRLTPAQRWLFDARLADPHHFNQALLLTPGEPLSSEIVERAFAALLLHHDALRLRFAEDEGEWRAWSESPGGPLPWSRLDLSGLPLAEGWTAWERAAAQVQASLDLSAGPLLRGVWLDLARNEQRLLLVVHHLGVDGVSWRILVEDLETACRQIQSGEAVSLPPKTTSFQEWAQRLEEHAQSPDLESELLWWRHEAGADLPLDPANENTEASARRVSVSLGAEETRALLQEAPAAYRTQINDLLLTALARALAGPGEALLIELEGHGREELFDGVDLSRTVGWLTTFFPVRLEAGPEDDPATALRGIKEHLRAIPLRGLGYGMLRWLRSEAGALPQPKLTFNYLGQIDGTASGSSLFGLAGESTGPTRSPRNRRRSPLTVEALVAGGRLQVEWIYCGGPREQPKVERWAAAFLARLQELIACCRDAAARRRAGYTPSDFPLAGIGQRELDRMLGTEWGIEDVYPLSPLQEGLLFHSAFAPGSGVYVTQLLARLEGQLDEASLESACRGLVERHPILRTSFHGTDRGRPLQVVHGELPVALGREDWSGLPREEAERRLERLLREDRERGFDLSRAPLLRWTLIRTGEREHRLVWTHHHIVLDGWSMSLLIPELLKAYESLRTGGEPEVTRRRPYRDYIAWLEQRDLAQTERYWRRTLAGWTEPTLLAMSRAAEPGLPMELRQSRDRAVPIEPLQDQARRHRLTLNTLVQGAWGLLLARYSGLSDVVFGITVSGRPAELPHVETMVGLFINTLPVRLGARGQDRLLPWLEDLQLRQAELHQQEHSPLVKVQEWSDVPRGTALFESILVFENYPQDVSLRESGASAGIVEASALEQSHYPLTFIVIPDRELVLRIEHQRALFDEPTIDRMLRQLGTLLAAVSCAQDPGPRLWDLPLLGEEERHQILLEWSATAASGYGLGLCLHERFAAQAACAPDAIAVEFEDERLTYGDLRARASRLAGRLRSLGVGTDVRVGLCAERSVELVAGILAIWEAGGAYVPLDPAHPPERLGWLAADAGCSVLLVQERLAERLAATSAQVLELEEVRGKGSRGNVPPAGAASGAFPESLAYVIHTSGSTGRPKGVMVSHRAIANRVLWMQERFPLGAGDAVLQKTPFSFDASIWELFLPLISGARLVMARPGGHQDPAYMARKVADSQVTVLQLVPSMLGPFLETEEIVGCAGLRRLFCGGELLAPALRDRVFAKLDAELCNLYGPTECAIDATFWLCQRADRRPVLPIGRPLSNVRVEVLDRWLEPVPLGGVGELCVGGVALARGYWGRPDLTAAVFIPAPGGRLYRTGDLARHLPDGTIEYLGRIDQQVKVRGFRIELGEIEAVLGEHPEVREAVVAALDGRVGRQLVAYVVPQDSARDAAALRRFLEGKLPAYLVPAAFVFLPALPRTASGKVDRRALPAPEPEAVQDSERSAPAGPVEELLAAVWEDVLRVERVGRHDSFFDLGGHSLLATQLLSRVRSSFAVELPLRSLFENPTVAAFADLILQQKGRGEGPGIGTIGRVPRDRPLSLSFAQERLWFLDRLETGSAAYNIPAAVRLAGPLEAAELQRALREVVRRHEGLRTRFEEAGQGAVQIVDPPAPFPLPVLDLSTLPEGAREAELRCLASEEAMRPFDLAHGPLLRVRLLRLDRADHAVLLTLHHIVSDGWSMTVLIEELVGLYSALALPEPSIQYADFAAWQRQWLQGEVLEAQLAYWKRQLAEAPPLLALPLDRPRPALISRGRSLPVHLPPALSARLRDLARQWGVTSFMLLMAAFKALLSRYSGQSDLSLGVPIAGRTRLETERLIGLFVNTLVLRTRLSGDPSFAELAGRVREVVLEAHAHQDLPFERLVEELQPERSLSLTPLFQVMFSLDQFPGQEIELSGLRVSAVESSSTAVRFDLELTLEERDGTFGGMLRYATELFDGSTLQRFLTHFGTLLEEMPGSGERRLSDLLLLSEAERHQVVREWNDTAVEWPWGLSFQGAFEAQVARSPDALAAVCEGSSLSYGELHARANAAAWRLLELGVEPDTIVPVLGERGLGFLAAVVGVLKAGGVYLPLDPQHPAERWLRVLENARVGLIVVAEPLGQRFSPVLARLPEDCRPRVLVLEDLLRAGERDASPPCRVEASHLGYSIFTSGSTGVPKGPMLEHRGFVNHLYALIADLGLTERDRIGQTAAQSFDISVWQLLGALLIGARVCIFREDVAKDGRRLLEESEREGVTVLEIVPSLLRVMLEELEGRSGELASLRWMMPTGEALPEDLAREWLRRFPGIPLLNAYGPAECSDDVSYSRLEGSVEEGRPLRITIGRPVANVRLYVVDREMRPVPVRVAGELLIGGACVGRGYLNDPWRTAESFVPDPFAAFAAFAGHSGARLYRTGDLVRPGPDGELEFLGRIDHQVKVRGHRIELGEIEAALSGHPALRAAVAVVREDAAGDPRLVAYVVPRPPGGSAEADSLQVEQWASVFDAVYGQGDVLASDPGVNLRVWIDSYTGAPVPEAEIAECVGDSVDRILALRPRRLLEIGCGTGLLLLRIAPSCESYWGTDVSSEVLGSLARRLEGRPGLPPVQLLRCAADDFRELPEAGFDTVVINEVVQYFPSVEYLVRVLEGAVAVTAPGGRIFLGGLRSLPLLEAFHASVALFQAPAGTPLPDLREDVLRRKSHEKELLLAPQLFAAVAARLRRIRRVTVQLKGGRLRNELTKFRYDVVLHINGPVTELDGPAGSPGGPVGPEHGPVGKPAGPMRNLGGPVAVPHVPVGKPAGPTGNPDGPAGNPGGPVGPMSAVTGPFVERTLDWPAGGGTLASLHQILAGEDRPDLLTVRGAPNARLSEDLGALQMMHEWDLGTIGELRRALQQHPGEPGVDPADFWDLGRELGYEVEVFWSEGADLGRFDALFLRPGVQPQPRAAAHPAGPPSWGRFGNAPSISGGVPPQLVADLRAYLSERLPEPMVPSALVVLDELPRTPSGKIDRKALPEPERRSGGEVAAPRTVTEEMLAGLWAEVLQVERVGRDDDFFGLGGHSLMATRLVSRIRETFAVELPLRALFEAPTIARLAAQVEREAAAGRGLTAPPIVPVPRDRELPLSFAQQRLWFIDQLDPGSHAYSMPTAIRLDGPLQAAALASSFREVVRRHESLRTTFPSVQGRAVQVIAAAGPVPLPVVDLAALPRSGREGEMRRLLREDARRPFSLALGPLLRTCLLRLDSEEHVLLFTAHHIVSDGWSTDLLAQEIAVLYGAFLEGRESPLPELPIQYADFAHWQRDWLQGEVLEELLSSWRVRLAGAPPRLELPTDRPRPAVVTYRGTTLSFVLPPKLRDGLLRFGRAQGGTLYMALLTGFFAVLSRCSGQKDLCVGSPIAGRNRLETEDLIGLLVNMLVLRGDLAGNPTVSELLQQVRATALEAHLHQDLPFEMLVDALQPERNLSHMPLFQVAFALQNTAQAKPLDLKGLRTSLVEAAGSTAKFDLTLFVAEREHDLAAVVEYSTDLFERSTVVRLAGHLRRFLEEMVSHGEKRVAELDLLNEAERHQLLAEWNDTRAPYARQRPIQEAFEQQAARQPEAVAVVSGDQVWSYREVEVWANRLARHLRGLGVERGDLVAVHLHRCAEMVPVLLGILKSGAAYVPVEVSLPPARVSWLLSTLGIRCAITQSRRVAALCEMDLPALEHLVLVDEPEGAPVGRMRVWGRQEWSAGAGERPSVSCTAEDLAYIIFTSGSTGTPKGVMVRHQPVVNLIEWVNARFAMGPQDRVLFVTSLSFDLSVYDIFGLLAAGGSVRVASEEELRDPVALVRALKEEPVTYWDSAPAALQQLVPFFSQAPGRSRLRLVFLSGDWVPLTLPDQVRGAFPLARVVALGGATEATVWSNFFPVGEVAPDWASVPYGRPIQNARYHVLDEESGPCPVGVAGDLFIGGECLALGYVQEPELTAWKFVPDGCGGGRGARLYRTGDRARAWGNGLLEFLGRLDQQVKIRGFRIELGEIEAALADHPGVREAVVLAREDAPGDKRLVAYVVAAREDARPETGALRDHLRERLPEYMTPSAFVLLEALPVTANGKLDRKALPAPERSRPEAEAGLVTPRIPAEELLAGLWAEVLGVDRIGVHDNFFDLGGDSILSIQIVARANEAGLPLAPRHVFEHQTIAELAQVATAALLKGEDLVTVPVPLTPAQMRCSSIESGRAVLLEAPEGLSPGVLRKVLGHLARRHDALRLRFEPGDAGWRQSDGGTDRGLPLLVVDLTRLPRERHASTVEKAMAQAACLDPVEGPLARALLLTAGPGEPAHLLMTVHPLVADEASRGLLLGELERDCERLLRGEPLPEPLPRTPFLRWAALLAERTRSEALHQEAGYWLSDARRWVSPLPVDDPWSPQASASSLSVSLDAGRTAALLQEALAAYHSRPEELLLAALVEGFAGWTGSRSLLVDLETHGREGLFDGLDPALTIGCFAASAPLLLDLEEARAPGTVIRSVKEQLRTMPHGGLGHGLLLQRSEDPDLVADLRSLPAPEVGFRYLGPVEGVPAIAPDHRMDVTASITGDRLQVVWAYDRGALHSGTMENLAWSFLTALESLVDHCLSPEAGAVAPADFELANVSQEQLNGILTKLGKGRVRP